MKKTCNKCGKKLITEDNFRKSSNTPDGYRSVCKECDKSEVMNFRCPPEMQEQFKIKCLDEYKVKHPDMLRIFIQAFIENRLTITQPEYFVKGE